MSKKVYIGVGHGGSDPGAAANGFKEKDLNLAIGKYLLSALKRCGVNTKISRLVDSPVWLETRIAECNKFKPDVALDIHNNAGGGDGAEVYYSVAGGTSKTLATKVLAEITKIGQNSRGIKTKVSGGKDYFGFIRETVCPAVIVECAFVDNKKDLAIIDTAAEQKRMAEAIAKGICTTLGVKYIAEVVTPAPVVLKVGDTVKVLKAVQYDNGKSFKTWFPTYTVISINGNRVVIGRGKTVVAAVDKKNLSKV